MLDISGSRDNPEINEIRSLLYACRFTEVDRRTAGLGHEPADRDTRTRWRELLYLRSVALVVLVRYADAEAACELVLASAERDDDRVVRTKVLGYGMAAAYFLGRVDQAVSRLDEVLAATEAMPPGPERMTASASAAVGAGMIGLTELSDQLMARLVAQVADAPPDVVAPGVSLFLHALMTTRRCQLALEFEQSDPARSVRLYRSVLDQCGRIGVEFGGDTTPSDRPGSLFAAHLCFAKIAVGESADVAAVASAREVTGEIDPFDAVGATTEIMWGLCQLRLALEGGGVDGDARAHWVALLRRLGDLACRTRTLVLQAEITRAFLEVADRDTDPLLWAAMRERHEAQLNELDWTTRLERARFVGLRSRTMRGVVAGSRDVQ